MAGSRAIRSEATGALGGLIAAALLLGCSERPSHLPDPSLVAAEPFVAEDLEALASSDPEGTGRFVAGTLGIDPPLRLARISRRPDDGSIEGLLRSSDGASLRFLWGRDRGRAEGANLAHLEGVAGSAGGAATAGDGVATGPAGGRSAGAAAEAGPAGGGASGEHASDGNGAASRDGLRPLAIGSGEERALILALVHAARPLASRGDTVWMAGGQVTGMAYGIARSLQEQRNRTASGRSRAER